MPTRPNNNSVGNQAIAENLIWGAMPGGSFTDDVLGGAGALLGTATWNGSIEGNPALESLSQSADGGYFPQPAGGIPTGRQWTLVIYAIVEAVPQYGKIFCVPFRNNATWTEPFSALALERDALNSRWRLAAGDSAGTPKTGGGTDWSLSADSQPHVFVATINGVNLNFWVDGVKKTPATFSSVIDLYFGNGADINLLNRNHLTPDEGTQGDLGAAWLFNDIKTDEQIGELSINPYLPAVLIIEDQLPFLFGATRRRVLNYRKRLLRFKNRFK